MTAERLPVALVPMTRDDYDRFSAISTEEYGHTLARNLALPLEQARAMAHHQIAGLLKDGFATPHHHFWVITMAGRPAGYLWAFVDPARRTAFIFDFMVDEPQRGRGIGTRALELLEDEARALGATTLGLNVFADNPVAQGLYRKLGYRVTNMNMLKALDGAGAAPPGG